MKNKKTVKAIFAIAAIGIIFVPMLYVTIYLLSVWNVYDKVNNVPVAFVNLDKPVTKDGKVYAIGKDLQNKLKDNTKLGWRFVSYEDAMKGVKGTKYYAVIEIPENFSGEIANASDGKFQTPSIIYIANQGKNFVFSQVSSKVATSIQTQVSASIQKEIAKTLVTSLENVKVSIKDASDGTDKLNSGANKLLNGSNSLASGTSSAASGANQLKDGISSSANGAGKLQAGAEGLLNGSNQLSSGLAEAADGSKQLASGLSTMANGEGQIVNGSSVLINGLNTLKGSLTASNPQISELVKGAQTVNENTSELAGGAETIDNSISQLNEGLQQSDSILDSEIENINASNLSDGDKAKLINAIKGVDTVSSTENLGKASSAVHALSQGLSQLNTGTKSVSDGVTALTNSIAESQSQAAAGVDKLISGASSIQSGSSTLLQGLNTATDKTNTLAAGLDKLNSGEEALTSGLGALNVGTSQLKDGLTTATNKTGELATGLSSINNGAVAISGGLQTLTNGTTSLNNGLNSGYNTLNDKLKFNADNMAEFVSNPVNIEDDSINAVKYYGEGLAPYFMSLSLWLGAMFISLLLTVSKSAGVFKNNVMNSFLGRFAVGALLVMLQAIVINFTGIKILGITPANTIEFFMSNIFISITFFSIIYGVSYAIGIISSAIMFIVLLLQLASSAGTFPIETAPVFYRAVNKLVPMTYSVSTIRMTISGVNQTVFNGNILVLSIFIIVFMIGGFAVRTIIDKSKRKNDVVIKESEAV